MSQFHQMTPSKQQLVMAKFIASFEPEYQDLVRNALIQSENDVFSFNRSRVENSRHDFNCFGFCYHKDLDAFYGDFSSVILKMVQNEAESKGMSLDAYLLDIGALDRTHHPYAICFEIARHMTYEAIVLIGLRAKEFIDSLDLDAA